MRATQANSPTTSKKAMEICPYCDDSLVVRSIHDREYVYGTGDSIRFWSKIPVYSCSTCEFQWTNWEAEQIEYNLLCKHLGTLNPHEIKQLRRKYGMSRQAFAQMTGIGQTSLSRWEKGLNIQNVGHDRYLRLLGDTTVVKHLQDIVRSTREQDQDIPENTVACPRTPNYLDSDAVHPYFELRNSIQNTSIPVTKPPAGSMNARKTAAASYVVTPQEDVCPRCDPNPTSSSLQNYEFVYGVGESAVRLSVKVPVYSCPECGFNCIVGQVEEIKWNALCQHFGILNPAEIRKIREKYRMSRSAFSKLTGIGEASLCRWEKGLNIQNVAHDRYLRILNNPTTFKRLKQIVKTIEARDQLPPKNEDVFRCLRHQPTDEPVNQAFELRFSQ